MRCFKVVWMVTLFLVVLTAGVANKLAMLTLTSAIVKVSVRVKANVVVKVSMTYKVNFTH